MPYEPLPFTGYKEEDVALIEWSAGKMFTTNRDAFLENVRLGLEGDETAQMTAVAMMAANCGCPVPGNALQSRQEKTVDKIPTSLQTPTSPKEEAWYITLQDYAFWALTIEQLIHILTIERNHRTAEFQDRKINYLSMKFWRIPGPFRAPQWPIPNHEREFEEGVQGVVNPFSFAIGRIFREGMRSFDNPAAAREFWLDLGIHTSDIAWPRYGVDFLLQVADHAVELGADRDIIMKSILSKGYLIAENNLKDLGDCIVHEIQSYPRRYPYLYQEEEFDF